MCLIAESAMKHQREGIVQTGGNFLFHAFDAYFPGHFESINLLQVILYFLKRRSFLLNFQNVYIGTAYSLHAFTITMLDFQRGCSYWLVILDAYVFTNGGDFLIFFVSYMFDLFAVLSLNMVCKFLCDMV